MNKYLIVFRDSNVQRKKQMNKNKIERIKNVLRRYFDTDDNGEVSKTFDEYFTASEAIDEIHEIVGNI